MLGELLLVLVSGPFMKQKSISLFFLTVASCTKYLHIAEVKGKVKFFLFLIKKHYAIKTYDGVDI
jgi:hypothetical protein